MAFGHVTEVDVPIPQRAIVKFKAGKIHARKRAQTSG
jgi:hypothetical protein